MISVSNNFKNKQKAAVRSVNTKVELYSGSTLVETYKADDEIQEYEISKAADLNKLFGQVVCQKINIKLRNADDDLNVSAGKNLKVYSGFDTEFINYPRFYITEINKNELNSQLSVTGYDLIYTAKERKISDLNLVAGTTYTIEQTINLAAAALGTTYSIINTNSIFSKSCVKAELFKKDETIYKLIEYIAEATGSIAYINHQNKLCFKGIKSSDTSVLSIDKDVYKTLTTSTNRRLSTITAIDGEESTSASVSGISGTNQFIRDNPIVNTDRTNWPQTLINILGAITINQFELDWFADISLEIGDKITLVKKDDTTVSSIILDDTIVFNGGLSEKTQWNFEADSESESEPYNVTDYLSHRNELIDNNIREATEAINGAKGGVITLLDLDNDGNPDNLFITDVAITKDDLELDNGEYVLKSGTGVTNVVRANYNGIAIDTGANAGTASNLYKTAITGEGINASTITTGELNADLIKTGTISSINGTASWNLDNGEFISGDTSFIKLAGGYVINYIQDKKVGYTGAASAAGEQPTKDNTAFSLVYLDDNANSIDFSYEDSNQNIHKIAEVRKNTDEEGSGGSFTAIGSQFSGLVYKREMTLSGSPYVVKLGVGRASNGTTPIALSTYNLYSSLNMPTSGYDRPTGVSNNTYYGRQTPTSGIFYPLTKKIPRTSDYKGVEVSCTYACWGENKLAVRLYKNNTVIDTIALTDWNQSTIKTIKKVTCDFPFSCTQFEIGTIPETDDVLQWAGWKSITLNYLNECGTGAIELTRDDNILARMDIAPANETTNAIAKIRVKNNSDVSKWVTFGERYIQPFDYKNPNGENCGFITYTNGDISRGLTIVPGNHPDGSYGVEVVDDGGSATGIKLRANTNTYNSYLGSGYYPWTYGYITNLNSDQVNVDTLEGDAIFGSAIYQNHYQVLDINSDISASQITGSFGTIKTNSSIELSNSGKPLYVTSGDLIFDGYKVLTTKDSDRNVKNSIEPLSDKYDLFFDKLKPVSFKYNDDDSQTYTGLIAQDVEAALEECDMDNSDIGILGERVDINGNVLNKTLNYEKLITLCVAKIQKLEARIEELEKGGESDG